MAGVRKVAAGLLVFGLGWLIGPVLLALIAGAGTVARPQAPLAPALQLLYAYQDREEGRAQPPGLSWELAAQHCGYDPGTMIDDAVPPGAIWTPFQGYFDLRMWMGGDAAAAARAEQAAWLATALTPFEQGFLAQCLRSTAFAPLCRRRVAAVLAKAVPQGARAAAPGPRDSETLCHFLDGVAARRGRPLSARAGIVVPPSVPADVSAP